jgi:pantoate--beta-alanine ligase
VEVIRDLAGFRAACEEARSRGHTVGFVPTMGALHEGHVSMFERARGEAGFLAVSIFVNPLQFGPGDDLERYPRRLESDLEIAEASGCELVFTPSATEMYPHGLPEITVDPGPLGDRLEGASRAGHFRGVLTVVAKLLHLAGPCRAYFGEKDAQQVALIQRMVADLDMAVTVVTCSLVRDDRGLAVSSRNEYLSENELASALAVGRALFRAAERVENGERDANTLRAEMAEVIAGAPLSRLEYVAVVDDLTWEDVDVVKGPVRLLAAAAFGPARLIDNVLAAPPGSHNHAQ